MINDKTAASRPQPQLWTNRRFGDRPAAYNPPPRSSRAGKVKGGGLNRPQLSVPHFHFAPHRTERTDFPYSALRVRMVARP